MPRLPTRKDLTRKVELEQVSSTQAAGGVPEVGSCSIRKIEATWRGKTMEKDINLSYFCCCQDFLNFERSRSFQVFFEKENPWFLFRSSFSEMDVLGFNN